MNFNQKIIAAKIEAAYGVDASPVGANAIVTRNLNVTPMEGDNLNRNIDSAQLGNSSQALVNKRGRHQYEVELAGAGAAGDAPAWGPILRACGFSETLSVGVDAKYAPVSDSFESVTEYMEWDGHLYNVLGARGDVTFNLNSGQYPFMALNMQGLFTDPAAGTIATPDFTGFQLPVEVGNTHTTTATLHGYTIIMQSLSIQMGNAVNYRNLVGQEAVLLSDRAPSGQIVIEAPTLAQKNYFDTAKNGTLGALQIVHGGTAGNIIQIDAPKVEIGAPNYTDDNGIMMMTIPLRYLPDAGNDEVEITVK
tara:strand:+ start:12102 stop:13022 length:921 start_codon:yes stop_codon:yes gene_type:complete